MAGASRFCKETFRYPSPRNNPEGFLDTLALECRRRGVDVVYPMSDISMYHVLAYPDRLRHVVVPFGPFEAYERLSDKWRLFELAAALGLSMPATHFIKEASELRRVAEELRFPVVIKPYRSQLLSRGRWLFASVRYADSWD